MSRERELVMEIEVAGRTFYAEKETLTLISDEAKILDAYFAEKKIENVEEAAGTHTYTFANTNDTSTTFKKNKIASVILSKVNKDEKSNKKHTTQALVRAQLTLGSYTAGNTITVDLLKSVEKISYPKITSAPMGYQVYLIAETENLKDKKVKLKIHEKESDLKLLKTKDDVLPVLVFAKKEDTTTDTEASDWIAIDVKEENGKKEDGAVVLHKEDKGDKIEVGIKKIQLRPKEDKIKTEGEDAKLSFEGWQEALFVRENETDDGISAAQAAEILATTRAASNDSVTLTRDVNADLLVNKKSFPESISGPSEISINGSDAEFILETYKPGETTADKQNIRWSLWVHGTPRTTPQDKTNTYITSKSKAGVYTYAKTEIIDTVDVTNPDGTITQTGGKNKLTIVFDKELEGKRIQIEAFRGSPDIKEKEMEKKAYVYTNAVKDFKVTKRETTKLRLQTQCESVINPGEIIEKEFGNSLIITHSTSIYIYHDGKISKTYLENGDKMRYVYVENTGEEHYLGVFDIIESQRWLHGTSQQINTTKGGTWQTVTSGGKTRYYKEDGNEETLIMTPFSGAPNKVFQYKKGNLDFAIYEDTSREYFNPEAFATVIGALAEVNFTDLVSNGSVDTDATGAFSVSHFN